MADARGWPMLALASRRGLPPSAGSRGRSGAVPLPDRAATLGPHDRRPCPIRPRVTRFSRWPYWASASYSAPAMPRPLPTPPMPLRPIWPGFLVDALFYAGALALLRWVMTAPGRLFRELSRLRQGRCIACGYDLGYDFVGGCPECGWRRTAEAAGAVIPPGRTPWRESREVADHPTHPGANGSGVS